jgi:hypothetical protein
MSKTETWKRTRYQYGKMDRSSKIGLDIYVRNKKVSFGNTSNFWHFAEKFKIWISLKNDDELDLGLT